MADFSPSNLLKAQALLREKYKNPEGRMKPSPVIGLGLKNQAILIPSHTELRKRDDRAVSAYLLARTKRATSSSRTHNHSGNRGDSIEQALTWSVFADKFSISLKQLDNNIFSFEAALAQQLENAMKNVIESAETYAVAQLQTNRTHVNDATAEGTWNSTNYAFEIAKSAQFYQILKSMMRRNDYKGALDVIANSPAFINAEFQSAQGAGNGTNTNFQFNGLNIVESYELADANYDNAVVLAMPEGSFACLPWIPKQNRQGAGDYNSYVGGFGSMMDPFGMGLEFAIHGYSDRADTSASNGDTQDVVMQFEVSVDMAFPTSPLSNANETTVFEAVQV